MNDIIRGNFDPNSGLASPAEDNKVYAEFNMEPVVDGLASKEAGRTIKKDVVYVKIIQPGESRLSVYHQPATAADVARFPRQWAAFKANQSQEMIGSPLSLLFPDSPAIVENFKSVGVRTVEQLAEANDTALQNMGMGARGFQEKAKAYLAAAEKGKDFHGLSDKVDALTRQGEADRQKIAALEGALAIAETKRGPGRPRNETQAA